ALGSQLERLATRSALGGGRPASPLSLGGGRQAPYRLQQQLQQQLREQHAERQLQEAQLAQLASAGTSGMLETLHTLFGTGEVAQALAGVGGEAWEGAALYQFQSMCASSPTPLVLASCFLLRPVSPPTPRLVTRPRALATSRRSRVSLEAVLHHGPWCDLLVVYLVLSSLAAHPSSYPTPTGTTYPSKHSSSTVSDSSSTDVYVVC
ncbi:unnamed protein product, partial [Prorocentrum cordatum]